MFSQKRERRETYNEIYDFLAFPFKLDDRNLIDKHNLLILFTPFKDLSHYNCIVRSAVTLKFNPYFLWNFLASAAGFTAKKGGADQNHSVVVEMETGNGNEIGTQTEPELPRDDRLFLLSTPSMATDK